MNDYYCYVYYDENWCPYYVGKGEGRRSYRLRRSIPRPPRERVQIFYFATEWEAYECEIELINFWKRSSDGGSLMNLTLGGAGSPGMKHTNTTRERMSKSHLGLKHTPDVEKRRIEKVRRAVCKPLTLIHLKSGVSRTFSSRAEAARELHLHKTSISRLTKGTCKQMKGWSLLNETN